MAQMLDVDEPVVEDLRAALSHVDLNEGGVELCADAEDGQWIVPVVCPLAVPDVGSGRFTVLEVMVFELRDQASSAAADKATGGEFLAHESLATVVWPSSVAVAEELARGAAGLRGLKVLEIGAGCGLGALAACRLGAEVLATDASAVALRLCEDGARVATRVEGAGGFRLRFLDVFDLIEVENALADFRPDLILCSDVLYDGKMARAVAQVLLAACRGKHGAAALVADPGREARAEFLAELAEEPRWRALAFEDHRVALGPLMDGRKGAPKRHDADEVAVVGMLALGPH